MTAETRSRGALTNRRVRSKESGFGFLLALLLVAVIVISCAAVLESVSSRVRREREEDTVWRGNQYARGIRLYYHKIGRYPQSVDDLLEGAPDLHFIRQAYKDPMNKDDGTWRFIYLNQAGQIIGSSRYASLQQMAIMDALGLQPGAAAPSAPGQPGTPASVLASTGSNSSGAMGGLMGALLPALPYRVISADNPQQAAQEYATSDAGLAQAQQASQSGSQTQAGGLLSALPSGIQSQLANMPPDQIQSYLAQQGLTPDQIQNVMNNLNQNASGSSTNQSAFGNNSSQSAFGNNSSQSAFGNSGQSAFGNSNGAFSNNQSQVGANPFQSQNGSAFGQPGSQAINPFGSTQSQSSLLASANAGVLQQKPTGPVDGPVLGGYLTGVGSKIDRKSIIWYHGAKKYKDWEFIWNPIEEQAAAVQQQINQAQGAGGLGAQGGLPVANPFGGSTGQGSGFSSSPSPQQPQQQQQPAQPQQ